MKTHTLATNKVPLPLFRLLKAKAKKAGMPVAAYIRRLIEKDVASGKAG